MIIINFLLIFIFTLSMPNLSNAIETSTMPPTQQTSPKKELNYTIHVPDTWKIYEENLGIDLIAFSPAKEVNPELFHKNFNIISVPLDSPLTLDDFYKYNLESLRTMLEDFNLESTEDLKIDGVNAKKIIFSHTVEILNVTVIQYLFLSHKTAYVMTFTSDSLGFDKIRPEFEQIADTFKFNK